MKPIIVECSNDSPLALSGEAVSVGVPFPKGELIDHQNLCLQDSDGKLLIIQSKPLNYWCDGSCKWVLCDFLADLPPQSRSEFILTIGSSRDDADHPFRIIESDDHWLIDTGQIRLTVDSAKIRPLSRVKMAGSTEDFVIGSDVVVRGIDGVSWESTLTHCALEDSGPVRTTLAIVGQFVGDNKQADFSARIHCFRLSGKVRLDLSLCNPEKATHPSNLWDLGDANSLLLKEWAVEISLQSQENCRFLCESPEEWIETRNAGGEVYQESSGGDQWNSPNHRVSSGEVPLKRKGWVLSSQGKDLHQGDRAQAVLHCGIKKNSTTIAIEQFWQRFPKAMACRDETVSLGLLPGQFPTMHELQGGEQITETLWFDFCSVQPERFAYPKIQARCTAAAYIDAKVFTENLWIPKNEQYKALLALSLDEKKGFFAKREMIDEYSWRNFGDIYADHEAAFHETDTSFISHYNNQYDPLYSFYRLFLTGHSLKWGELANDLAHHLADIDINHTNKDREEYCHGPFWHTDHYLDAGLSTHRMASQEHLEYKNPVFCGGGPDAEHCYSAGLLLDYFTTGNPKSRKTVLDLADWVWISLHGPQTIGATLLRTVKNMRTVRRSRGSVWPRYPFTRGTGNCLNTQLDAFELTDNNKYLDNAICLIRGAVHPEDDPSERDLLNAELNWSYTVLLSAIGRFLQVKIAAEQIDEDFSYARDALLTYAHWMKENEYPYLEKPEKLEYPNETWAGQDLRKGIVFLYAAKLAYNEKEFGLFREKAESYLHYGVDYLSESSTSHYTRPLALVLQNGWGIEALKSLTHFDAGRDEATKHVGSTQRLGIRSVLARMEQELKQVLPQTGLERELNWLRARLR